jgi:hypothetical protein
MDDSLSACKKKVRDKILGKFGVHAVGAKTAEDAVYIYTSDPLQLSSEQRQELEAIAAPYKLQIVADDEAHLS